ncbi:HupE/UreJ family protein [Comamonas aquatica]|uniref:HupE/UreJ family protein n=1 Tax=Comamonas aquatica TaxID=225991 RepID=UPI001E5032AE|nr:HupE/UreJ family protein [Comamonas aquatica]
MHCRCHALAGAVLGMAAGSALLHLGGMALGHRVMQRHQLLARLAGAATAVLGVALLTRLA